MHTTTKSVHGEDNAAAIADALVRLCVPFSVEPYPEDEWRFELKREAVQNGTWGRASGESVKVYENFGGEYMGVYEGEETNAEGEYVIYVSDVGERGRVPKEYAVIDTDPHPSTDEPDETGRPEIVFKPTGTLVAEAGERSRQQATTVEVEIPFGLTVGELVLDPATLGNGARSVDETLALLADESERGDSPDGAVERILRSALLLHQAEAGSLAQCLDTALVWERG